MGCLLCGKYSRQWDDTVQATRIHPAFIPVTWLKCSYSQKILKHLPRSRLEKRRSREPSQPALSYDHMENFIKDLEVRRDLAKPGQPALSYDHMENFIKDLEARRDLRKPGSCEAALRISSCSLKLNYDAWLSV